MWTFEFYWTWKSPKTSEFYLIILWKNFFFKTFWFQNSLTAALNETTNLQNLMRHKENDLIVKNQKINELESIIKL